MPILSIIIPVYNRERVLAETLESCLAQTCADLEIIVVDDGSTDGSTAILEAYSARDSRVRVFKSVNMGQCVARNIGASLAKGDWLWFLDSDDLLLPNAAEMMLQASQRGGVPMAMCGAEGFWDHERDDVRARAVAQPAGEIRTMGLWGYWPAQGFSFNTALLMRSVFLKSGGFQPALRACEEMNLTLRLLLKEPDMQAAIHPRAFLLKRYDENSLACQARRDAVPWQLVSLNYSADAYLAAPDAGVAEIRQYLFDQLYVAAVFAYRNGQIGLAVQGLAKWRKAQLPPPPLSPKYHDALHRFLGFQKAERLLALARKVLRR